MWAYPPAYRADRGEEITGPLLEAVPPGWDLARSPGPRAGGTCRTVIRQERDLMVVLADFAGPPVAVFLLFARRMERPPLSLLWLPGPLVTVGPTVIALVITASLVATCALAWLLRRRIRTSPPMTHDAPGR
jgi:hypothetical protein